MVASFSIVLTSIGILLLHQPAIGNSVQTSKTVVDTSQSRAAVVNVLPVLEGTCLAYMRQLAICFTYAVIQAHLLASVQLAPTVPIIVAIMHPTILRLA